MLAMCLPACSWAQIVRTPFNFTITARTLLLNVMATNFRDWFFSFQHQEKNYRIASMFIMHNMLNKGKVAPCFVCGTTHFLKFERIEWKAWKHSTENWKVPWLNNEIHLSRSSAKSILPVSLFTPPICGL